MLQGNEVHPSLEKILPSYLLLAAAWYGEVANYLPLGSIFAIPAGWAPSLAAIIFQGGEMSPTHAMESCATSSQPFSGRASRASLATSP